jgi:multidrug efflux pump subunit AcrA (membrane-fusion protein)
VYSARDEAAARLTQARITAPADGLVSRVAVRIGTVTGAGQELLRLVRDGRLELNARVPELDLDGIAPGQPALVRHGGREIRAEVRAVAPTVTPESRLGLVHIALPEGSGLLPGMFARADNLLDRSVNLAGTLSACATMAALQRRTTPELMTGRTTLELGAPARADFGTLANRVRRQPRDIIVLL